MQRDDLELLIEAGKREKNRLENTFNVSYEMARQTIKNTFNKDLTEDEYYALLVLLRNYDFMYFNPDQEDKEFAIERAYIEIKGIDAFDTVSDLF